MQTAQMRTAKSASSANGRPIKMPFTCGVLPLDGATGSPVVGSGVSASVGALVTGGEVGAAVVGCEVGDSVVVGCSVG